MTGEPTELKRVISFWDSVALVVGLIIGSGIFRAPASVAAHLPTVGWILAAWVIGGVLSLAGGLAVAELGVRYPASGGQFVFLRESFGPSVAFTYGWTFTLISKPSVLAGIATVFATYFSGLAGFSPAVSKPLAMGAIALLTFVNCLGVKSGTRTQNLFTLAKGAGLALLGIAAFLSGRGDWAHFSESTTALAPALGGAIASAASSPAAAPATAIVPHGILVALALSLITILYTYDGWIDVTYAAGEVINPGRVLPRAIISGTALCTGLYLLANAAYIYLLSPAGMPGKENIAAIALQQAFGPAGATALSVLVVVSTLGILNGSILTGVRVPFAMARDGMMLRSLGRVHPKTLSPVNALVVQGLFSCVIVQFSTGFDEIASLFVSTTWFFYAVTIAGLLVVKRREKRDGGIVADPARFRMPLSPWPAVLFIVVTLFIIGSDLAFSGPRVLVGMAIVALGIPVYRVWRALAR